MPFNFRIQSFEHLQWEKVEDKYAVTSLVVAGGLALWTSAGMISVSISFLVLRPMPP